MVNGETNTKALAENFVIPPKDVEEFVGKLVECKLIPVLDGTIGYAILSAPTLVMFIVGQRSSVQSEIDRLVGQKQFGSTTGEGSGQIDIWLERLRSLADGDVIPKQGGKDE